ncbi:MAG: hypothetical protein H0V81_01035 [Solirubrobacterales bacterium]|nr:hypothetical protein [Solirubrobacterales bacterium]
MTSLRVVLSCLLGAIVGLGAVTALSQADRPWDPRSGPSDEAVVDRSSQVVRGGSENPTGGPPWAVAEYKTADGRVCAKPGREVAGKVGALDGRGKVVGSDSQEGGDCLDPEQLEDAISYHVSTIYRDPTTNAPAPVSFIWGHARADVESVQVTTEKGVRNVDVRGSSYIVVVPGVLTKSVKFDVRLDGGGTKKLASQDLPQDVAEMMLNPPTGEDLKRDMERRSG